MAVEGKTPEQVAEILFSRWAGLPPNEQATLADDLQRSIESGEAPEIFQSVVDRTRARIQRCGFG